MDHGSTPHVVLAPLALPWALVSVTPATLRHGLYVDPSRTGMAILYCSSPASDVLVLMPAMLAMFTLGVTVS